MWDANSVLWFLFSVPRRTYFVFILWFIFYCKKNKRQMLQKFKKINTGTIRHTFLRTLLAWYSKNDYFFLFFFFSNFLTLLRYLCLKKQTNKTILCTLYSVHIFAGWALVKLYPCGLVCSWDAQVYSRACCTAVHYCLPGQHHKAWWCRRIASKITTLTEGEAMTFSRQHNQEGGVN